jgi:aspartyl-tRNA(Asn)/glutamyl-tRNA(Gln) amidotransferase subunit B
MTWRPVIGIETHVQLNTSTKLFCSCANQYDPNNPNSNICEFCTGQPGALPMLNKEAVKKTIILGVALGAKIPKITKWDRKNYFYPDSPNGYQITQLDHTLVQGGNLEFYIENKEDGTFTESSVAINRAHLEGDAGKLLHASGKTMIDFNRSNCPLVEIITDPVIHSKEQAMAFVSELQLLVRKIGISYADMEKGQMRFDVNISLQDDLQQVKNTLPSYRIEIKNINSVRSVGRAIEYEISRQLVLLESGLTPSQETRGWDDVKNISILQRSKEDAMDYRYFPEPDIPPLKLVQSDIPHLNDIPLTPSVYRKELIQLGIPLQIINTFLTQPDFGSYFDQVKNKIKSSDLLRTFANILTIHVSAAIGDEDKKPETIISSEELIQVATLFEAEEINNKAVARIIELKNTNDSRSVLEIVEEEKLLQVNDDSILEVFVSVVISANEKAVEDVKNGKEQAIGSLIGMCMKESKGQGNPQKFRELLRKKILGK